MTLIHPTALVDPAAQLDSTVSVGPYTTVGPHVKVGAGTTIAAHCVIEGHTTIGCDNRIFQFNSIGAIPQDKKYAGEPCELHIGDRNTIREFCTFNIGSPGDAGVTKIGSDNWIMAYVHIAHDCVIGDHTIFANNASLAGHAEVGDWAILGGFSGAHQFCKIGAHAFVGMGSLVNADVPPFVMTSTQYAEPRTINAEGLKRRGFSPERIRAIKNAYRTVYMAGKPLEEAKAELRAMAAESDDVKLMLDFIEASSRGILR